MERILCLSTAKQHVIWLSHYHQQQHRRDVYALVGKMLKFSLFFLVVGLVKPTINYTNRASKQRASTREGSSLKLLRLAAKSCNYRISQIDYHKFLLLLPPMARRKHVSITIKAPLN